MLIKILGTRIEVLGRGEYVAASAEGGKDGGRDEKWDVDVDGTISGNNVDSNRVAAAQLTAEGQHMWQ